MEWTVGKGCQLVQHWLTIREKNTKTSATDPRNAILLQCLVETVKEWLWRSFSLCCKIKTWSILRTHYQVACVCVLVYSFCLSLPFFVIELLYSSIDYSKLTQMGTFLAHWNTSSLWWRSLHYCLVVFHLAQISFLIDSKYMFQKLFFEIITGFCVSIRYLIN